MTTIANRIAEARKALEMNQSELARTLDVSPQAVQSWESGKARPRGARLEILAKVLGRSVEWLMTGQDPNLTVEEAAFRMDAAYRINQIRSKIYDTSSTPEEGARRMKGIAEYLMLKDQLKQAESEMRELLINAMRENDWYNRITDTRLMMEILTITQAAAEGKLLMTEISMLDTIYERLSKLEGAPDHTE
ncbi:helix-turn-helix domain-containing protein [Pseudomonas sp. LS.1a]|uniref:helix-turn-helix domain-containing protein n=1 Tax=Pseudomonas sp. LS.1a TaxID=2920387 RepID=UPI001F12D6FF|nr:helix-turn-helix transcriptional regulator [Pseudomonas sp. LS.1a]UMY63910.1 helix-turn-helix transcriptional regulator [Pseudomonas sp. LS.1a]